MLQRRIEKLRNEAARQNRGATATERGKLTGSLRRAKGDKASMRTIGEGLNLRSAPSARKRVGKIAGLLMSDLRSCGESGRTMRVGYGRAVAESVDVFHADAGELRIGDNAVLPADLKAW
jgi:hypothetical protein